MIAVCALCGLGAKYEAKVQSNVIELNIKIVDYYTLNWR